MAHIKNVSARTIFLNVDSKRITFNPDSIKEVDGGLNAIKKGGDINKHYVDENMLVSVEAPREEKEDKKK